MRFIVDYVKLILYGFTAVVLLALSVFAFSGNLLIPGIIISVLFVIYAVLAFMNGRVAVFKDGKAELRLFFVRYLSFDTGNIGEVGVAGTGIIKPRKSRRTGTRYIYIADRAMSDDERFQMCFKWPPRDVIYFRYTPGRLKKIRQIWKGDIIGFNAGNINGVV